MKTRPILQLLHTPTGVELIRLERQRQITHERYLADHDDLHTNYELTRAAISYALIAQGVGLNHFAPPSWPWKKAAWKPSTSRIRNLIKSGALIAAEIDRIQRLVILSQKPAGRKPSPLGEGRVRASQPPAKR